MAENENSIKVYRDYTTEVLDPNNTEIIDEEKVSQYNMDYILVHFNEMIRREIKKNPNAFTNPYFQKFLQWVAEYSRILREARDSIPNFVRGKPLPKKSAFG